MSLSSRSIKFRPRKKAGLASLALGLTLLARLAAGEVAWHADLPAATKAAQTSGKPVLAVVDASWNRPDAASPDVFSHPEVAALIAACFEPVRIDADAEPQLTRDLAVEHVPSACVLDSHGTCVTRFGCSTNAAEFVAAAARAAQVAAAAAISGRHDEETAPEQTVAADHVVRKGSATATASALADKVRNLAGFAETSAAPAGQPSRFHPIPVSNGFRSESMDATVMTPATNIESLPTGEPELAQTPPRWPAEPAGPSPFAAFDDAAQFPSPSQTPDSLSPPPPPRYSTFRNPVGQASPAAVAIEPAGSVTGGWLGGIAAPADPNSPATAVTTVSPAAPATPAPGIGEAAANLPETTPPAEPAKASAASSMMTFLKKPWSVFSRPAVEPTPPPPTLPPARSVAPAAVAASAPPQSPDQHGSMPLGLEGYCPVTLVERGTWVEGRAQWGARHRGRTYLFAGPEQQQAFLASPDRYAPALSGDDPVLAFESGRSEPGRRAYGVTYQSRMYLFSTPETRAAFSADPGRYTARVMVAEGLVANDGTRRF